MGLFMAPFHMLPSVLSGFHPMLGAPLSFGAGYHGFPYPSPPVHRMSSSPNVVTEEDFQKMIQIHRKRRLANEVLFLEVCVPALRVVIKFYPWYNVVFSFVLVYAVIHANE